MELKFDELKETLDVSLTTSKKMLGGDDPNFLRIHHHNHHILLYIKDHIMKGNCKNYQNHFIIDFLLI